MRKLKQMDTFERIYKSYILRGNYFFVRKVRFGNLNYISEDLFSLYAMWKTSESMPYAEKLIDGATCDTEFEKRLQLLAIVERTTLSNVVCHHNRLYIVSSLFIC